MFPFQPARRNSSVYELRARRSKSLEDRVLIDVSDRTIEGPGAVGLWTKADSVTAFYELTIVVLREK
jgi:hypothetical protein